MVASLVCQQALCEVLSSQFCNNSFGGVFVQTYHPSNSCVLRSWGVLSGKWVHRCAAENGSLFCPSGFKIAPYLFFENVVSILGAFSIFTFSLRIGCKTLLNLS